MVSSEANIFRQHKQTQKVVFINLHIKVHTDTEITCVCKYIFVCSNNNHGKRDLRMGRHGRNWTEGTWWQGCDWRKNREGEWYKYAHIKISYPDIDDSLQLLSISCILRPHPRLHETGREKEKMVGLTSKDLIILSCSPYDRKDKQAKWSFSVPSLTVLFCWIQFCDYDTKHSVVLPQQPWKTWLDTALNQGQLRSALETVST